MNKVVLIGRLTKEPDMRYTAGSGIAVTTFTIAVDRAFQGADGKREADFIQIRCWRKLAELCANNLQKGRLVGISGSIQTGKYTAQDGTTRYTTEVVADEVKFLDHKKDGEGAKMPEGFHEIQGEEDIPF